jgi:hypothetical protein
VYASSSALSVRIGDSEHCASLSPTDALAAASRAIAYVLVGATTATEGAHRGASARRLVRIVERHTVYVLSGLGQHGTASYRGRPEACPWRHTSRGLRIQLASKQRHILGHYHKSTGGLTVRCVCGAAPSRSALTVSMATTTYDVSGSAWTPSGDQHSPLVYQGAIVVSDRCAAVRCASTRAARASRSRGARPTPAQVLVVTAMSLARRTHSLLVAAALATMSLTSAVAAFADTPLSVRTEAQLPLALQR